MNPDLIKRIIKILSSPPILILLLASELGGYYFVAHFMGDKSGVIDTMWINFIYHFTAQIFGLAIAMKVLPKLLDRFGGKFQSADQLNLSSQYVPVIDGLRAVAVLSVLFYHAGFETFGGGYIGVDVFFVISGYLISGHIIKELIAGKFTFGSFYEKRIRRIFPALFVMLLVVTLISAWLYDPKSLSAISMDGISSATSWANFKYWSEEGYFKASELTQPFLHTWSLSVEEQFYLLLPLFLFLVFKFGKMDKLPLFLLSIILYSFITSVITVMKDSNTAFYWLHTRAWELLLGALLIFIPKSVIRTNWWKALPYLGIALVLLPVFIFNRSTPFPGIAALVPVLGSAIIIFGSDRSDTAVGKILSSKPFTWIGKISYSLYLWHWPVLVLSHYYNIFPLGEIQLGLVFVVMLFISWVSWYFVERPFRSKTIVTGKRLSMIGIPVAVSLIGISIILQTNLSAVKALTNPGIEYPDEEVWNSGWEKWEECVLPSIKYPYEELLKCPIGDQNAEPTFLLIGDSHAQVLAEGMDLVAKRKNMSGFLIVTSGQPPVLNFERKDAQRAVLDRLLIEEMLANYPINKVIITANWASYSEGCSIGAIDISENVTSISCLQSKKNLISGTVNLLDFFKGQGIKLDIIQQTPVQKSDIVDCVNASMARHLDPLEKCSISLNEYESVLTEIDKNLFSEIRESHEIVEYPLDKYLCNNGYCPGINGVTPLYFDDDHLSMTSSHLLEPLFDHLLTSKTTKVIR